MANERERFEVEKEHGRADQRKQPITHEQARDAAMALINTVFSNQNRRHSRHTVPAQMDDDDVLIVDYIKQQEAGWQAHAESVGPDDNGPVARSIKYILEHPFKPETESLNGAGTTKRTPLEQSLAELKHEVYLLKPEEWLQSLGWEKGQEIPRSILGDLFMQYATYRLGPYVDRVESAQPASIEKTQDEHELFAINYAEWAHGVKENHDRRPTFEEQNSYTDGWNDAIRAALQRNAGRQ